MALRGGGGSDAHGGDESRGGEAWEPREDDAPASPDIISDSSLAYRELRLFRRSWGCPTIGRVQARTQALTHAPKLKQIR